MKRLVYYIVLFFILLTPIGLKAQSFSIFSVFKYGDDLNKDQYKRIHTSEWHKQEAKDLLTEINKIDRSIKVELARLKQTESEKLTKVEKLRDKKYKLQAKSLEHKTQSYNTLYSVYQEKIDFLWNKYESDDPNLVIVKAMEDQGKMYFTKAINERSELHKYELITDINEINTKACRFEEIGLDMISSALEGYYNYELELKKLLEDASNDDGQLTDNKEISSVSEFTDNDYDAINSDPAKMQVDETSVSYNISPNQNTEIPEIEYDNSEEIIITRDALIEYSDNDEIVDLILANYDVDNLQEVDIISLNQLRKKDEKRRHALESNIQNGDLEKVEEVINSDNTGITTNKLLSSADDKKLQVASENSVIPTNTIGTTKTSNQNEILNQNKNITSGEIDKVILSEFNENTELSDLIYSSDNQMNKSEDNTVEHQSGIGISNQAVTSEQNSEIESLPEVLNSKNVKNVNNDFTSNKLTSPDANNRVIAASANSTYSTNGKVIVNTASQNDFVEQDENILNAKIRHNVELTENNDNKELNNVNYSKDNQSSKPNNNSEEYQTDNNSERQIGQIEQNSDIENLPESIEVESGENTIREKAANEIVTPVDVKNSLTASKNNSLSTQALMAANIAFQNEIADNEDHRTYIELDDIETSANNEVLKSGNIDYTSNNQESKTVKQDNFSEQHNTNKSSSVSLYIDIKSKKNKLKTEDNNQLQMESYSNTNVNNLELNKVNSKVKFNKLDNSQKSIEKQSSISDDISQFATEETIVSSYKNDKTTFNNKIANKNQNTQSTSGSKNGSLNETDELVYSVNTNDVALNGNNIYNASNIATNKYKETIVKEDNINVLDENTSSSEIIESSNIINEGKSFNKSSIENSNYQVNQLSSKQELYSNDEILKSQVNGLVFRVQIAASRKPMSKRELKRKYKGNKKIIMFTEEGWYKYYIGEFSNYNDANYIKIESRVKDAFISAYFYGKKIDIKDALANDY